MSSVTNTEYSACTYLLALHASSSPFHPYYHHAGCARAPPCGDANWRTERMWIGVEYSTVAWLFVLPRAVRAVDRGWAEAGGVAVWCGRAVFYKAAAFNQPIGEWDMSSVTTTKMSACIFFTGLHALSGPIHP